MKERVMFGALAVALFIPFLWFGGIPLQILVGVLAMAAVAELFKLKNMDIFTVEGLLTLLATFALVLPMDQYLSFLPIDSSASVYTVFVFLLLLGTLFNHKRYSFDDVVFPIAASFYIGVGFQNLLTARIAGLDKVLFALFIIWATDIGAYVVGSYYGKRKLMPEISPNKTVEGSLGGVVVAVVVAFIFMLANPTVYAPYHFVFMLLLVALFSAFAQLGDLVESAMKRHFGVKDSGKFLPGHGGVIDRFDSMIFVLPLMHFFGLF